MLAGQKVLQVSNTKFTSIYLYILAHFGASVCCPLFMMSTYLRRLGLPICIFVYLWVVLAIQNADLLYQVHNFTPWLATADYLKQFIGHPGGLREWTSDFLTQLFYYPWLGTSAIVLLWAISVWALIKAYNLFKCWSLLAFVPVFALLASITQLGYWIFCLKAQSYWFGPTLGLFVLSLGLQLFSVVRSSIRVWIPALWMLLAFPVTGWYATLGLITMLIDVRLWRNCHISGILKTICSVLVVLAVLTVYYHQSPAIHWRETLLLYGFHHLSNPEFTSLFLETPFWVMAGTIVLLPIVSLLQSNRLVSRVHWIGLFLCVVSLYGANMLNYRNVNFHTELTMLRQAEEGRWEDLLATMGKIQQRPTREMVLLKDVALLHTGQLGNKAFHYDYRGVRPQMTVELPIHMNHSAGPLIYYWYGLPNFAFMWCMEDNIEYGLSPFFLKLMYRCSLANREYEVARKYRRLLDGLLFYRDYAVTDEELETVRGLMTENDELTNDRGFCEIYLLQRLSHEKYDNLKGRELAVYEAMLMRDRESFKTAVEQYRSLLNNDSIALPQHFHEAAILFGLYEPDARYADYCQQLEQYQSRGLSREAIGQQLYAAFGNTYWWYYDFYTNNKTY